MNVGRMTVIKTAEKLNTDAIDNHFSCDVRLRRKKKTTFGENFASDGSFSLSSGHFDQEYFSPNPETTNNQFHERSAKHEDVNTSPFPGKTYDNQMFVENIFVETLGQVGEILMIGEIILKRNVEDIGFIREFTQLLVMLKRLLLTR